ncbi:cysteine-rich CWC family protein [Tissierella sp. Yu-01]|uniref:cysteine-rich CWC family protein n=1 Tax=Tissierella sp. Yu-01 TaxID=3035694 RepID=UPI00240E1AC4|nr:cysteine-rich CWC family protein [Tissierella sp. Yu-01]WFA08244.1 cysteine-rich CWC family protein [Tissierella sp. Yu-01]
MRMTAEERTCPLCGKDNNCQHGQSDCWCNHITVPKHILDMVPEDKKGKACVCKECIEKYTNQ